MLPLDAPDPMVQRKLLVIDPNRLFRLSDAH
jgi:hypothetical protein